MAGGWADGVGNGAGVCMYKRLTYARGFMHITCSPFFFFWRTAVGCPSFFWEPNEEVSERSVWCQIRDEADGVCVEPGTGSLPVMDHVLRWGLGHAVNLDVKVCLSLWVADKCFVRSLHLMIATECTRSYRIMAACGRLCSSHECSVSVLYNTGVGTCSIFLCHGDYCAIGLHFSGILWGWECTKDADVADVELEFAPVFASDRLVL